MSLNELLVILVVALFVFGPEKLPMLATHLGRLCRKLNAYKKVLKNELSKAELRQEMLEKNIEKALEADKKYSDRR